MNARAVVKLAAGRIESSAEVRSWLENDERGSWERDAQAMIEQTAERRKELGIADEQAASEIADRLALRALSAALTLAKKS